MANVDGGLGGSCFFDGDCGGPLYCHVEGVGGKFQVRVGLLSILTSWANFLFYLDLVALPLKSLIHREDLELCQLHYIHTLSH